MKHDDNHTLTDEEQANEDSDGGTSRRAFLKGSGAVASAGLFASNSADLPGWMEQLGEDDGSPTIRSYTIHAVDVDIVYNDFGLHQPHGAIYVLEEQLDDVRDASGKVPGESDTDTSVIEPLTIRANEGDIVDITFVNDLDRPASIHQTGLPYDVATSDGMAVGTNPDTTVGPGETIQYRWFAKNKGTHYFTDGVSQAWDSSRDGNPEKINSRARGLFGALVVEPKGATWTDPYTGGDLRSGTRADIHDPEGTGTTYREFVIFYHDPGEVVTQSGGKPTWPDGKTEQSVHGINYRGETTGLRLKDDCEDCEEEAAFYSSWVHGDPGGGDLVYELYSGDPLKFVFVGGNLEENHVHHMHNHRWKEISGTEDSETIDSQTVAPGETFESFISVAHGDDLVDTVRPEMSFEEAFEVGAGGMHEGAGDILFHCHLFPHYAEGMNGMVRIHDKEQEHLQRLPNNDPKLDADDPTPGFPEFVPGEEGRMPPESPSSERRPPTQSEQEALGRNPVPGAPYTDPCPDDAPVREYTIVALNADIVYNDAGDHDPDGMVFALEEDAAAIRNGDMNPEPLVIRANVGDCIDITLKNELEGGTSVHPHFVSFDVLGSDSLANGYNYEQGADPGDELHYRWYADEEGTIFFHDHVRGVTQGMHGGFAALVVEPEGSEWLDPHTCDRIDSGTQAIVQNPDGDDFRELVVLYHDFAPLLDRHGNFVNDEEEHNQNEGVMAMNYRNAPYFHRDDADSAYVHSSYVHGDPETPVLESYAGDPIRVRLVMAPWEEQHNFTVHGLDTDSFGEDPRDSTAQIIGTSEAFTFRLNENDRFDHLPNPDGLPVRDYLYGSMPSSDLWIGMWGINRIWDGEVSHLKPLPDRKPPKHQVPDRKLLQMGHPAPFSNWAKNGHKAKLTYDDGDDRRFPADKDERQNKCVGQKPQPAESAGYPGPKKAPVRRYNVTAFQHDIQYNEYGDHDPHGIVFALDEDVDDIRAGIKQPEPLTIRANEGECIEIELTNALPKNVDNDHAHPEMLVNQDWKRSNRISLHPLNITYDVQGSDGATVGFNFDQTIEPGETTTYRWYADERTDGCVLWDMADVRSHRHHGAFGQLIVEPEDSEWLDPATAEPIESGTQAMIKNPNGSDVREFALAWSDGMHVVNPDGSCVVPPGQEEDHADDDHGSDACNQLVDHEDQGYVGINNRAEPFDRRFRTNDDQRHVFNSSVHGDPDTPTLNAYVGDPVAFQVSQTADKARGVSFHLAGHQWQRFPGIEESPDIGVVGDISPGKSHRIKPLAGAGGLAGNPGDYIYQEMKLRRRLEAGWWGIFRVGEHSDDFTDPVQPLPDNAATVQLDDRPGWQVARGDATDDGNEDVLIGVPDSDVAGTDAGAAYIFFGPVDESKITDLSMADVQLLGIDSLDRAGVNVHIEENLIIIDDEKDMRYIFKGKKPLHGTMSLADAHIVIDLENHHSDNKNYTTDSEE